MEALYMLLILKSKIIDFQNLIFPTTIISKKPKK